MIADTPDMPLVSVLVRSMDRPFLREALDAVALQTYPDVEVVVVNAKGGEHAALGTSCGRFPLRVVNAGGSPLARPAAANTALDAARGDWLIFLDDDDSMDPDHLERLVRAALRTPGRDVVYTGVRVVDAFGSPVRELSEPYDRVRLWQANFLPIHAVLFARTLLGQGARFDQAFEVYEDWDFWNQLACLTDFTHISGISATYRLTGDSGLSADPDGELTQRGRAQFFEKWRSRIPPADLAQALAQAEEARALAQRLHVELDARQAAEADYRTLESGHRALDADHRALKSGHQALEADYRTLESDHRAIEAGYRTLESDHRALQAGYRTLESDHRALEADFRKLEAEKQAHEAAFADLETAYRSLEQSYFNVLGSASWRVTAPLRDLRAVLNRRAMLNGVIHVCRALFRALPVSEELRWRWRYRLLQTPLRRFFGEFQTEQTVPEAKPHAPPPGKEAVRARAESDLAAFLAAGTHLVLPTDEHPRVSVLLVLFNQAGLTYGCLDALAQERELAFETIIVDNASTDRTSELLDRLTGAVVIRNADNEGFLLAVNRAARAARGEFLLVFNNDAVVLPGALQAAVRRMDSAPEAGAVGGAILLWDGSLQEAGSIIWRDGSCLGYGRGDDPAAPVYDFVRDVDYCSGAFLLVRRALFEALGGFDTDYAPAYYEESDFCARLWERGHRVVYDPAVRIRHFEFASAGAQSEQAIALQVRNRARFAAKHPEFLARQREPSQAAVLFARQRLASGRQRILLIDDRAPRRDLGGGFPRARDFVVAMVAEGHFVTHYPLQFPHDPWDKARAALPDTVEIMQGYGVAGLPGFLEERRNYYACIIVSRPHNMQVVNALHADHPEWFAGTTLVFDAEALFSLRDITKAAVRGEQVPPAAQERMIRAELDIARIAHRIVTVCPAEAAHYRRHGHAQVHVLGHTLNARRDGPDFGARRGYLFVGAIQEDDTPNGDSLIWFLREAWPRIRARGDARLDVVGLCEAPEVRRLATSGVRLHGQVESVEPFYDTARVFIVPTRFAAGIPHKAHEAAAHGVPMVVTSLIAAQLGWDSEIEIADEGGAFAERCIALHDDEARWQARRQAAWAAIDRDCSPSAFHRTVAQIVAAARPE
ncbi:MAG: hypothetical protein A2V78_08535 [Betaproteobacteria bacterium RBG_16_64_18]|nr:MAG: hypothetical protein A2V78_08535 [Betaproteobacteria bacterium RBG_16_64_18]